MVVFPAVSPAAQLQHDLFETTAFKNPSMGIVYDHCSVNNGLIVFLYEAGVLKGQVLNTSCVHVHTAGQGTMVTV